MTKREIEIRVLEWLSCNIQNATHGYEGDRRFEIKGTDRQISDQWNKVGAVIDKVAGQLMAKAENLRETENRRIARSQIRAKMDEGSHE